MYQQPMAINSFAVQPLLNGPPSAMYLPTSYGKTPGTNGRTFPVPGWPAYGQQRSADQTPAWAPAMYGSK